MRNGTISINYLPFGRNRLMYRPLPTHCPIIADNPLTIIRKGDISLRVKTNIIRQHHHIHLRPQPGFQILKLLPVGRQQNIIRIQPHTIGTAGLSKGCISGRSKIVNPGEIKNPLRISSSNFFSAILRASIHNNNLIHQIIYRLQAAAQHIFLIPHNHTQAYAVCFTQSTPSFLNL